MIISNKYVKYVMKGMQKLDVAATYFMNLHGMPS
jgi:hypothetical protein